MTNPVRLSRGSNDVWRPVFRAEISDPTCSSTGLGQSDACSLHVNMPSELEQRACLLVLPLEYINTSSIPSRTWHLDPDQPSIYHAPISLPPNMYFITLFMTAVATAVSAIDPGETPNIGVSKQAPINSQTVANKAHPDLPLGHAI